MNIDHVATVRNARGENYPSPLRAALLAQKYGANSITPFKRRQKTYSRLDLKAIKKKLKIPLNLEMAPTNEMLNISLKFKPTFVCIVPEKRKEITTEGGLNLKNNFSLLKKIIIKLKKKNIRTSLFIEPKIKDIIIAKKLNVDCIEIHTGKLCSLSNQKKSTKNEFKKIKKAVLFANKIGLEVHAGHGINFITGRILSKINGVKEFNIGHFLVGESIFVGLKETIKKFKKILSK